MFSQEARSRGLPHTRDEARRNFCLLKALIAFEEMLLKRSALGGRQLAAHVLLDDFVSLYLLMRHLIHT